MFTTRILVTWREGLKSHLGFTSKQQTFHINPDKTSHSNNTGVTHNTNYGSAPCLYPGTGHRRISTCLVYVPDP